MIPGHSSPKSVTTILTLFDFLIINSYSINCFQNPLLGATTPRFDFTNSYACSIIRKREDKDKGK